MHVLRHPATLTFPAFFSIFLPRKFNHPQVCTDEEFERARFLKSYDGLHGQAPGTVLPLGNVPGLNSGVLCRYISRYTDLPRLDFCHYVLQ
jgi:hypothetical protein